MKICNKLVKKGKKYGFSDRTQGGQIYSCKGPNLTWKRVKKSQRVKRKYWVQQVLFAVCPKRTNLVTLARMLRRPESTKKRVEPATIGITAIEIQLDRVRSTIAVMTSTLYVALSRRHIRCWRIVQHEMRQSWRTNLFDSHAYKNEPTFGHELNLD